MSSGGDMSQKLLNPKAAEFIPGTPPKRLHNPEAREFIPRNRPGVTNKHEQIDTTSIEKPTSLAENLQAYVRDQRVVRSAFFNSVVRPGLERRGIILPRSDTPDSRYAQGTNDREGVHVPPSQAQHRPTVSEPTVRFAHQTGGTHVSNTAHQGPERRSQAGGGDGDRSVGRASTQAETRKAVFDSVVRPVLEKRGILDGSKGK